MTDPVVYLRFRSDEHDAVRGADRTGDSLDRLERRAKSTGQQFTFFDRDVKQASRGAVAGSGAFQSLGRSIAFASAAFLSAAGFTAIVKDAIEVAKSLGKETRKTELVFGTFAPAIIKWSHTTATSLGLARDEALHFTAAIGRTLIAMGKSQPEAAKLAPEYVKIGTALAGFAGTEPEEGIEAVRSAIAGSTRSLREYGVYLSTASINAEALRLGLVKSKVDVDAVAEAQTRLSIAQAKYNQALKEYGPGTTQVASAQLALKDAQDGLEKSLGGTTVKLTEQEKATARLSLIQRESATAQEHFNQKGASQTRTFHALVRDLEASLGEALLPTIRELMTELNKWLEGTLESGDAQRELKNAVAGVRAAIEAVWPVVKTLAGVARGATEAVGGLKNMLLLLIGLKVASKLAGYAAAIEAIGVSAAGGGMGDRGLGTGVAGGAAGKVSRLRGSLVALGRLGTITILISVLLNKKSIDEAGNTIDRMLDDAFSRIPGYDNSAASRALQGGGVVGKKSAPKTTPGGSVYHPRTGKQGGNLQIPASYTPTHATAGFPGSKTAIDIFAEPGTRVLAPEDGRITRHSGSAPKAGSNNINGYSLYYIGDGGTIWFMTHLATLSPLGRYKKGDVLGTVAGGTAGGAHVHVDNNAPISFAGGASTAAAPKKPRSGGGDLVVGAKDQKPKAKPFDLVPRVFQERLERAKLSAGMKDDLDALEAINTYLTKRLKLEKDRRKRIELLREIVSVRKEIADIKGVGQG
ncbi:MAG: M23 family metallopeptidase, partial [Actinomycetota bacterium]|nr:M23 family metallopeptidase [Actinomycetota bacterium]